MVKQSIHSLRVLRTETPTNDGTHCCPGAAHRFFSSSILILLMLLFGVLLPAGADQREDSSGTSDTAEVLPGDSSVIGDSPADSMAAEADTTTQNPEERAARKFAGGCAGCHTIGGGKLQGPDLAPTATWPRADLVAAIKRMERYVGPLADEEVSDLAALLSDPSVRDRISAAEETIKLSVAASLDPGSAVLGSALFRGARPFSNGGLSCISCHNAETSGGTLAVPLADVADRMGETALISAIENANFPVMDAAYAGRPITRQEAMHLEAYLRSVAEKRGKNGGGGEVDGDIGSDITAAGGLLAVLFLAGMIFYYRKRHTGAHAALVRRYNGLDS